MNRTQKTQAKNKIREFVLSEIENQTQGEVSPVDGSTFKPLSDAYAKFKRSQGEGTEANLHLTDSMLDSLHAVNKENAVEFRITDRLQKLKSFNHNTGDTVPKRQFLPDDERRGKFGTFNQEIRKGITDIIRSVRSGESEGEE